MTSHFVIHTIVLLETMCHWACIFRSEILNLKTLNLKLYNYATRLQITDIFMWIIDK